MKRALIIAGALLLISGAYVLYILTIAGEFRTVESHFEGTCEVVPVPGSEDIVITADGRGAYVSSHDRLAELAGRPWQGAIRYYDLESGQTRNLTPDAADDFRPHGVALWEAHGRTTLFVVNHPGANLFGDHATDGPAHTVEVYDIVDGQLRHRETIADETLLITPNDIAPVSHEQFYVTNDHGTGDATGRKVEDYLRIKGSHVLYYDGSGFRRLPGEYHYANGIIATPDATRVYMAAVTDRRVHVFDRDTSTGDLTHVREVFADTGVDNLNLDPNGDIWIGSHPKLLTLARWMKAKRPFSPTQVLKIDVDDDFAVHEVLLSTGEDMSASTAAARHGGRLLVGSLDSRGFLDCQMSRGQ